MPNTDALFAALRRFARTMANHYDITDVLYELGDQICEVLRSDGAGVALLTEKGELRFATATNEPVVEVERAQIHLQAGPCVAAIEAGRPIAIPDIRAIDDWPEYREVAEKAGVLSMMGVPMILDEHKVGSLNIYDTRPREWNQGQIQAAELLADVAAAYVLNASELARTRRTAEQLRIALDSRVVIEQAKGRLAGDLCISVDEAFARLRNHARSNNRTLMSIAEDIVDGGARALDHV